METTERQAASGVSRRSFLKTVAATGGGVAALAAAGTVSARDDLPTAEIASEKQGYRETAHIQDYYAKADF